MRIFLTCSPKCFEDFTDQIAVFYNRPGQEKPLIFVQTLYSGGQRGYKDRVKNDTTDMTEVIVDNIESNRTDDVK